MQCHTPPPFSGWNPHIHKMPPADQLPFPTDLDDDDPEPPTPEPPEYGPAPGVIVH
jgi:hypothetical protein